MTEEKQSSFWFTVEQLIDILKTFPPVLPVLTSGIESGYEKFYHPQVVRMKHESHGCLRNSVKNDKKLVWPEHFGETQCIASVQVTKGDKL